MKKGTNNTEKKVTHREHTSFRKEEIDKGERKIIVSMKKT